MYYAKVVEVVNKTTLLLNIFKTKQLNIPKFYNITYICPTVSFLSVDTHPFKDHNNVYHKVTYRV